MQYAETLFLNAQSIFLKDFTTRVKIFDIESEAISQSIKQSSNQSINQSIAKSLYYCIITSATVSSTEHLPQSIHFHISWHVDMRLQNALQRIGRNPRLIAQLLVLLLGNVCSMVLKSSIHKNVVSYGSSICLLPRLMAFRPLFPCVL